MSRVKLIKEPGKFFERVHYSEFSQQELEEMAEKGDRVAILSLADLYCMGDEKNGLFVDLDRAAELYALGGSSLDYEFENPKDDPSDAVFTLEGPEDDIASVKGLVSMLAERYGTPDNEFGLYVPTQYLMKALVGSDFYRGNILFMDEPSPTSLIIKAEMNDPHALYCALSQAFTGLTVDFEYVDF